MKILRLSRRVLSVWICALLSAPSAWAAAESEGSGPPAEDFKAYVQRVQEAYPALRRQHATAEVALASRFEAISGALPRVTGMAGVTRGDDAVYVFGAKMRQEAFTAADFAVDSLNNPRARTDVSAGLHGEVPLFNALQTFASVKSANRQVRAERSRARFVASEARFAAAEAYLNLLLWERLEAAAGQTLAAAQEDIRQAEELNARGAILGADFFAAKVQAAELTQRRRGWMERRRVAEAAAAILAGRPPESGARAAGGLPGPDAPAGQTAAAWIASALERRPDLAAARSAVEAQAMALLRERATFLPRIVGFGTLEQHSRNWHHGGESYLVGVKGSLDLFDPSYVARTRRAGQALAAAEADEAALRDAVRRAVTEAAESDAALRENWPVLRQGLADARQAETLMEPLYREGRKSIADLLQIRRARLDMEGAERQARFGLALGGLRLRWLSGELDDGDIDALASRIAAAEAE